MTFDILRHAAVSAIAGAAGALGLGGGGVLLLYLSLFEQVEQLRAQGINLLFFLPCAVTALALHTKSGLVRWRAVLIARPFGLAGAWLGVHLARLLGGDLLRRAFGLLLGAVGLRELLAGLRPRKKNAPPER